MKGSCYARFLEGKLPKKFQKRFYGKGSHCTHQGGNPEQAGRHRLA